jgi:hypothetical protein
MPTRSFLKTCLALCSRVIIALLAIAFGIRPLSAASPRQTAFLKASNPATYSRFGEAIAIAGDTIVVGAPFEDSNATTVNGDQFNTLAESAGAAYVLVRAGTNWTQQAYLKASNAGADDLFGVSVAVSGDIIVVGATQEDSSASGVNGNQQDNGTFAAGAAYVFVRNGTNWTQEAYLKASNPGEAALFGCSVAISGETIIVGALSEGYSSGAAYVFQRDGTNWHQQAYLKAFNSEHGDEFGVAVDLDGDRAVIGARYEDSGVPGVNGNGLDNGVPNAGAAYVFVRTGTNWVQEAYLKAFNPGSGFPNGDEFGRAVAISGHSIVVGAPFEQSSATGVNGSENNDSWQSGAAYVFERQGTNWSQTAFLKSFRSRPDVRFGSSVAVFGNTIAVGARTEHGRATGVNGDQDDVAFAFSAGAVYTFVRGREGWRTGDYLKASNTGKYDEFGSAVSLWRDTLIVNAPFESSDASVMNGGPDNNALEWSGAAYVFDGLAVGPALVANTISNRFLIRIMAVGTGPHVLERASSPFGPWNAIETNIGPGNLEFEDADGLLPQAFYRIRQ